MMDPQVTFEQFGGRRAMVMIGGTPTVWGAGGLTPELGIRFKARAKNGAKEVRISLAGDDTYTVVFTSARGNVKGKFEGIYCDQLRELFERETGLYLSLGTMKAPTA